MDKDVFHIYNGILLSHKKGEILLFVQHGKIWNGIMLRKISRRENNKYHMIPYEESKNKQKKPKKTHRNRIN